MESITRDGYKLECNYQKVDNPKELFDKIEKLSFENIDQRFLKTETKADLIAIKLSEIPENLKFSKILNF